MKRTLTLIVALLLILLITRLEDYLGQVNIGSLSMDKDQIDYYLSDFSVMAITDDGSVKYELAGRHLSHWQTQKQSLIITPRIKGAGSTPDEQTRLSADEARIDQTTQLAELTGNVRILKPEPGNQGELDLSTDHLNYNMQSHEISTDAVVSITSPSGTMQSTGLTGKLDEDLLRFDSNVRSIYKVK
ncbi:MAG: LPS export ABC transporter periplasmic protein LptC [Gammaproteobacteria bacterium]|nr:LPS export ABC transporter periplasmic protein LptC [Gammaproteobacteria bacterium]MBU1722757.1 LPS export ABC transporter periplasmic protein LptC [Gammaproteobacteria bacterium]MBU2005216.1 LPS export ABC transporter periplasmic protein LptC [Gammaproteobacteria bacterium]